MRQLLYASTSAQNRVEDDLGNILATSRRNNHANDVTGLLWTDGRRFLQVLEGDAKAVGETFERIGRDARHRAIVVLQDQEVAERSFGTWSMALCEDTDEHIDAALANAAPGVRGTFKGLIAARRAAK